MVFGLLAMAAALALARRMELRHAPPLVQAATPVAAPGIAVAREPPL